MNKKIFATFIMASFINTLSAQQEIRLFPDKAPGDSITYLEKDNWEGDSVGGLPVLRKTDVGIPEITIFQAPMSTNPNPAVLVCPGGGYGILAYDMEGTEVCSWLNSLGITAVLVKYRVPRRPGRAKHEAPLQDVQRAISYVRYHAEQFQIDPSKIGVMGFSAGAHLSVMASTSFKNRTYSQVDEADTVSCRPDFCLLIYPAYLSGFDFTLSPEVKVSSDVPPTMMIQAEDDKYFVDSSLFYYYALKQAKVPAWIHLYSSGGHGYGMRNTGHAVNEWPLRAADWFKELKLIP